MPTPFDKLTIAQLQQAIAAATLADYAPNALFYKGDHWQEGCGWVGPQPQPTETGAVQVMLEIKRAFVSKNAVRETVGRHVAGVIGREPAWGFTVRRPLKEDEEPTAEEQALIDEAEAALTEWWDQRGLIKLLRKATATLLLGQRASLRLFVPPGMLREGAVPVSDLVISLGRIFAHHPELSQAILITDTRTQQQCSAYVYTETPQLADGAVGQGGTFAELSYVDPDTQETVLRIIGGEVEQVKRLKLGGRLWLHEAECPLLITEQVRDNQKQLNLAKTMQGRNVVQGGFLERTILNGQMPGTWVDDASVPGGKRFVADSNFRVGAGKTNFLSGIPIRDTQGKITDYTDPSVVYRDPVSVDTFQATSGDAYAAILDETHQRHALIAGDAAASGESRKQARADFEQSLKPTKTEIDRLVRWLLETALLLAAIFSGRPGRYDGLRATSDCRLDSGPLSADEQQQIIELVDAELLDRESAMSRVGVEDVDATKQRIAAERAARQVEASPTRPTSNDRQPTTDDQPPMPDKVPA